MPSIRDGSASRHAAAKEKRRNRILKEARNLLSSKDTGSFSVRSLAAAAEITVPTIYNLVGSRADVMLALCSDIVDRHKVELKGLRAPNPIELLRKRISALARIMGKNEKLYRATHIAWDELMRDDQYVVELQEIRIRAAAELTRSCRDAQQDGLLLGSLPAELLGMQIYLGQHEAAMQWAYRRISISGYERRSLIALYLTLAADADDPVRASLHARIKASWAKDCRRV